MGRHSQNSSLGLGDAPIVKHRKLVGSSIELKHHEALLAADIKLQTTARNPRQIIYSRFNRPPYIVISKFQ